MVTEFTGDQLEMINETVVEAITGAIMAMIAELTGDWIRDQIGDQSEMINKTAMEMTSELIPEMILELTSDPDGCPLTVYAVGAAYMQSPNDSLMSSIVGIGVISLP